MNKVFSDVATLASWLKTEAALARVQENLGLIPEGSVGKIEAACAPDSHNLEELGSKIAEASHPLTPIISAIEARAGTAAQYVHFGATTQDIMDTSTALQVRAGLDLVLEALAEVRAACVKQAVTWRNLPMAGRTHGQHAVPITLGLKFALWAEQADEAAKLLKSAQGELCVQFAGAAGTLATLADGGAGVRAGLAKHLELGDPGHSWHTLRNGFAHIVSLLAMASTNCGQIANEVVNLQRTEIAELSEGAEPGTGGSSTMPQKQNPMLAQNIVALARLMEAKPAPALAASRHEHERDMAAWTMEWAIIPESFQLTHAALVQSARLVRNLVVHEAQISANLRMTGGLICAEAVMMDLANELGRSEAHHLIKELIAGLADSGKSFEQALLENGTIAGLRSKQQIMTLLEPANYTGEAGRVVDSIVAKLK